MLSQNEKQQPRQGNDNASTLNAQQQHQQRHNLANSASSHGIPMANLAASTKRRESSLDPAGVCARSDASNDTHNNATTGSICRSPSDSSTRQTLDNGSNQSTSDSGFGCTTTNSLSSESSVVIVNQRQQQRQSVACSDNQRSPIEQKKAACRDQDESGFRISSTRESKRSINGAGAQPLLVLGANSDSNNNSNNETDGQIYDRSSKQSQPKGNNIDTPICVSSSSSSSCIKSEASQNKDTLDGEDANAYICDRDNISAHNQALGTPESNVSEVVSAESAISCPPMGSSREITSKKTGPSPIVGGQTDGGGSRIPSDDTCELSLLTRSPPPPASFTGNPVKSSLKKRLPTNLNSNTTAQPAKHKRNVTFNQTVIVFCEEIEASSPSDHCDPPVGYRGHTDLDCVYDYESEKFHDHRKSDMNQRLDERSRDDLKILNKIVGANSSTLSDDQLFGLLEDESLLENFKLECEDLSNNYENEGDDDDHDFATSRLNSNQSYLCHEAISDDDSEDDSSLPIKGTTTGLVGAKKDNSVTLVPCRNQSSNATSLAQETSKKLNQKNDFDFSPNSTVTSVRSEINKKENQGDLIKSDSKIQIKSAQLQQRSLPARMKVSIVDANQARKGSQLPYTTKQTVNVIANKSDEDLSLQKLINVPVQNDKLSSEPTTKTSSKRSERSNVIKQPQGRDNYALETRAALIEKGSNLPDQQLAQARQADLTNRSSLGHASDVDHAGRCHNPSNQHQRMLKVNASNSNQAQAPHKRLLQYQHQHQQTSTQAAHSEADSGNIARAHDEPNSCHICQAIESASSLNQTIVPRPQLPQLPQDAAVALTSMANHQLGQALPSAQNHQPPTTALCARPVVLNPSCVSCCEVASMQQQQGHQEVKAIDQSGQPQPVAGPPRPVAHQLVYVVDQQGNRLRALQLLRPSDCPQQGAPTNVAGVVKQPVMILPNNYRLSNPISVAGQRFFQIPVTRQIMYPGQVDQAQVLSNQSNTDASTTHSIINDGVARPIYHQAGRAQTGLRHHTVYYVQQPLGAQNIRHSIDLNEKSFPDVHEIRRMDGLRGPVTRLNLSQQTDLNEPQSRLNNQQVFNQQVQPDKPAPCLKREDSEDPTFGFSKRPSVKVVSKSNSNVVLKDAQIVMNKRIHHNQVDSNAQTNSKQVGQNLDLRRANTSNFRAVSHVASGSQTLDRKTQSNFGNQQQPRTMKDNKVKENMTGTSSMSNINSTLSSLTASSLNNTGQSQQLGISENQNLVQLAKDAHDIKGTVRSFKKRWLDVFNHSKLKD